MVSMDFATTLKLLRTLRHLSQVELAKAAGVAPTCMSYLEAGKILPGPEWERRLLDALGYQPELEPMLVALANLKASETQPHSAERVS
jgi:DNA-binding XRE family transcriptional regulator